MSSDKKYLSVLTSRFFPDYIKTEYSQFVLFFQKFFEYCEESNNIVDLIFTFTNIIDIDKVTDEAEGYGEAILEKYLKQYLSSFPAYRVEDINLRKVIKHAKDFYSKKGTEQSYQYIFRILNHAGVFDFYYPSHDILIISDESNGLLSSNKYIHSNYYRSYYTYQIESSLYGYDELKDIISGLLHPAGCKVFFLRKIQDTVEVNSPVEQDEVYDIFLYNDIVNQYSESLNYNSIYDNTDITWNDIEDIDSNVFLSMFQFDDLNDTFYYLENGSDEYFPYQIGVQLSAI